MFFVQGVNVLMKGEYLCTYPLLIIRCGMGNHIGSKFNVCLSATPPSDPPISHIHQSRENSFSVQHAQIKVLWSHMQRE